MENAVFISRFLVDDLVQCADVGPDAGPDDVGGDTAAGVQLPAGAQLHQGGPHGLPALGDGLDLEVRQLVVMADDLLNGQEGGVDGAVPGAHPLLALPVLLQGEAGHGGGGAAAGDDVGDDAVDRGHLHGGGGHDGVQLPGADEVLFGGDALEGLVDPGVVLLRKVIAQVAHHLHHLADVVPGGEAHGGRAVVHPAVEGGAAAALALEQPPELGGGPAELRGPQVLYNSARIRTCNAQLLFKCKSSL